MDPAVARLLACPIDAQPLHLAGRVLGCAQGHRFDLTRQGTATLLARATPHDGDTGAMLDRRMRVFQAGTFDQIRDRVVAQAADADDLPAGGVLDLGAGPGWYLGAVLDRLVDRPGLAIDVSKAAVRRASRCHPRAGAVVADLWQALPVLDGSIAVALSIFAPRPAGLERIVAPGGVVVTVTPEPGHLAGLPIDLPGLAVASGKASAVANDLAPAFVREGLETCEHRHELSGGSAADLAAMGPAGHHLDDDTLERLAAVGPVTVTTRVTIQRFRRQRPDPLEDRSTATSG